MLVTLTFDLGEEVTPELFGRRVAEACFSYGALRPGESVLTEDGHVFTTAESEETE